MPLRRPSKSFNLSRFVSFVSLVGLLSTQVAWATSFGPLQGNNEMGRPLRLHTDLSNLNDDAKGQLRSTCMTANFVPSQEADAGGFDNRVQMLFVDFVPDGKVGGRVFLKSREAISDPVGTIRLRSECPLAVFEVTWSVLLDPSKGGDFEPKAKKALQADSEFREFSFENSPSLDRTMRLSSAVASQKTSNRRVRDDKPTELAQFQGGGSVAVDMEKPMPSAVQEKPLTKSANKEKLADVTSKEEPKKEEPKAVPSGQVTTAKNDVTPSADVQNATTEHTQLDELALLDQKLADVNLIPSANQQALPGVDKSLSSVESRLPNAIQVNDIPLLIGVGSLLMLIAISGFWFYRQRQLQPASSKVSSVRNAPLIRKQHSEPEEFYDPVVHGDVIPIDTEVGQETSKKHAEGPNPLMLNSFFGVDQVLDDETGGHGFEHRPSNRSSKEPDDSLNVVLGMVNRADVKLWKLPEAYEPLISGRNKSLALSASPQSRVLRTQVGLLELAYQEAKQNRILQQDLMEKFVQTMLEDLDLKTLEIDRTVVPDLVHNYLSAKFCEVSGPQEKSSFKANCLALALVAEQWPMCFDSPLWEECVNESSVGV
jgi:hypothetical protein